MAATAERTDPALWERVKRAVTRGAKGGEAGQWSARKAQLAVQRYKAEGGGYKGRKSADNHLTQWTREDWGTKSGAESGKTHERYLPRKARAALSDAEYKRTTEKKRSDTAKGRQFSAQPRDVARKTAAARKATPATARGRKKADGADDPRAVRAEFGRVVNMTPAALRKWLGSTDSRSVGMTQAHARKTAPGGPEAVGHAMGRRILELKATRSSDLGDDDLAAMRKVIGYVHRHIRQRPDGDVTETRWRRSLMNWGHDPLRD